MLRDLETKTTPAPTPVFGAMLNKHVALSELSVLINQLAAARREPTKTAFFHAKVSSDSKANLGEVLQCLEQNFLGNSPRFLKLDDRNEILVICHTDGIKPFSLVENETSHLLTAQNVEITSGGLSERGIDQLVQILSPVLAADDLGQSIALRRFARTSNAILVLDDDPVILRIMENMLKPYGHVETYDAVKDFLPAYQRQAPNIVFVDINLQGERGTDVSSLLSERVDPGSFVVMISADAVKTNVLESRYKGAKGFIGKPISLQMVTRHLSAAPTMYQKSS